MRFNYYLPKKLQGYFSTGFVLLFAGILLSSCLKSKNDDYVPELSNVLIVNAYTNSPSGIDFYYGDSKVSSDSYPYSSNSPYYEGLYGGYPLYFTKPTAAGDSIFTKGSAPGGNKNYSIFIAGDNADAFLIEDNLITPATGKAAIRFVNASKTAGSVDVTLNGTTFSSGIAFQKNSDFKEVSAEATELNVFAAGTTTNPLATYTFTPDPGKSYTIYTRGIKDATDTDKALGIGIVDHTFAAQ